MALKMEEPHGHVYQETTYGQREKEWTGFTKPQEMTHLSPEIISRRVCERKRVGLRQL